jgi:spore maturation protein CgeB
MHQGFDAASFGIVGLESPVTGPWYADVGMVGSMGHPVYRTRCERLLRLKKSGFNVKWWGKRLAREMRNFGYIARGVNRAWAGREVYAGDFTDVIRHVKIVIGQDADTPLLGRYLSNRSFSVPGCGGFYLARRTEGIESLFAVDREVVVFDSDEEMIDKARFYLNHEEARRNIALAGQKRVLGEYTYSHILEKIFHWVREERGTS